LWRLRGGVNDLAERGRSVQAMLDLRHIFLCYNICNVVALGCGWPKGSLGARIVPLTQVTRGRGVVKTGAALWLREAIRVKQGWPIWMSYSDVGWRINSAACGFFWTPCSAWRTVVSGAVPREVRLPLLLKDVSRD
jgi:hypothetical protein